MSQETFEHFSELVKARRSMREFTDKPVPEALMREIFTEAAYAPSNCNTQPWKAIVVTGEKAKAVQDLLLETVGKGQYQMDFPYEDSYYPPHYNDRKRGVAKLFYGAACIPRDDKVMREAFMHSNLTFYGAPQAVFLFVPDWAQERETSDLGMFAQTLMLSMRARGIGSCPQTILGFNAAGVRDLLQVEPGWKLMFGISFGYVDWVRPLNQTRTERAPLDEWFSVV